MPALDGLLNRGLVVILPAASPRRTNYTKSTFTVGGSVGGVPHSSLECCETPREAESAAMAAARCGDLRDGDCDICLRRPGDRHWSMTAGGT